MINTGMCDCMLLQKSAKFYILLFIRNSVIQTTVWITEAVLNRFYKNISTEALQKYSTEALQKYSTEALQKYSTEALQKILNGEFTKTFRSVQIRFFYLIP